MNSFFSMYFSLIGQLIYTHLFLLSSSWGFQIKNGIYSDRGPLRISLSFNPLHGNPTNQLFGPGKLGSVWKTSIHWYCRWLFCIPSHLVYKETRPIVHLGSHFPPWGFRCHTSQCLGLRLEWHPFYSAVRIVEPGLKSHGNGANTLKCLKHWQAD